MNESDRLRVEAQVTAIEKLKGELDTLMPQIAQARRVFAKERSEKARTAMEVVEQRAQELNAQFGRALREMQDAIGLTDADVDELERLDIADAYDKVSRIRRNDLAAEGVPSTGHVDESLAAHFEELLSLVGARHLDALGRLQAPRLIDLAGGSPLSLVRGIRPESEQAGMHRFSQALLLAKDLLAGEILYDHFAGAMLVPQVARLAERLPQLREIAGGLQRTRSLWRGPSPDVDSTVFELLVGASCEELGRKPEFLDPTKGSEKSPDLFCDDPYPLAIECKRKRPLSQYEIEEEKAMRSLFHQVEAAARRAGMWGTFILLLSVDALLAPANEIVTAAMQQRYAGGNVVQYGWGRVAYLESPPRVRLPANTRLYSPNLLQHVFAWDPDVANFDGIICTTANPHDSVVDVVEKPVGLLWANLSDRAVQKRSWGPMSAVTQALEQFAAGDFGAIYVAYQEGARSPMADERLSGIAGWLKQMTHPDDIRVPVCKLVRLYPRALGDGAPDLIESTVSFVAEFSDAVLPTLLPSSVFTHPETM